MRQCSPPLSFIIASHLLALIVTSNVLAADAKKTKTITVCVDETETAPLSFEAADGEVRGIYADLARIPLEELGYHVKFRRLPWRRCVDHELKTGASDAALSAAWSKAREAYAWFPADAEANGPKCRSKYALICNGPVLLVPASSPYKFNGNRASVPEPVRITLGYTQVEEFRMRGLKVDEGPDDQTNVGKMLRDGTGSALVWRAAVQVLSKRPSMVDRFRQVDGYSEISDGFLPFSKQGKVSKIEAEEIWAAMARLRANPEYETQIAAKYTEAAPKSQGALVLCGGSLDLDPKSKTYLSELAPTVKSRLPKKSAGEQPRLAAVMSGSASNSDAMNAWQGTPGDTGYVTLFSQMGFRPNLVSLNFTAYGAADSNSDWIKTIAAADVAFLNGGDQARHYRALVRDGGSDSQVLKAIRELLDRGGVVLGTSAGAHVAGNPLFGVGDSVGFLDAGAVHHLSRTEQLPPLGTAPALEDPKDKDMGSFGYGLGLWDQVLLDSHSAARGRLGRMIVALAAARQTTTFRDVAVAIGIDENTCVAWDVADRIGRVIGHEGVWIVDVSKAQVSAMGAKPFAAAGIELSYLMAGDTFTLAPGGALNKVTTSLPPKPKRQESGRQQMAFAGDLFGSYGTTEALHRFVGGNMEAMDVRTLPERSKTRSTHLLTLRRSAYTKLYEHAVGSKKIAVDRLILEINRDRLRD